MCGPRNLSCRYVSLTPSNEKVSSPVSKPPYVLLLTGENAYHWRMAGGRAAATEEETRNALRTGRQNTNGALTHVLAAWGERPVKHTGYLYRLYSLKQLQDPPEYMATRLPESESGT